MIFILLFVFYYLNITTMHIAFFDRIQFILIIKLILTIRIKDVEHCMVWRQPDDTVSMSSQRLVNHVKVLWCMSVSFTLLNLLYSQHIIRQCCPISGQPCPDIGFPGRLVWVFVLLYLLIRRVINHNDRLRWYRFGIN